MFHKRSTALVQSVKNTFTGGLSFTALTSPLVHMWIKTHRCLVCKNDPNVSMQRHTVDQCIWFAALIKNAALIEKFPKILNPLKIKRLVPVSVCTWTQVGGSRARADSKCSFQKPYFNE